MRASPPAVFKFVSLWDSFHGASLDAISVGGEAAFRQGHRPAAARLRTRPAAGADALSVSLRQSLQSYLRRLSRIRFGKGRRCRRRHRRNRAQYAVHPAAGLWKKIRAACDKHGTLLILDEIPIGLGRSGKLFAFEHYDILPDMVVLGKGLGGGILPLAALITRDTLDIAGHMALGHYTHEKNPVACAAALATLEFIVQENLPERARQLGEHALQRMRDMAERHPLIGDVRGLGLLLGIELVITGADWARQPAIAEAERVDV
ncbi:MAG: aminotransferase class III-fold pyridoxal phosphate-dependent enzyme [Limisphaerales bacterium]